MKIKSFFIASVAVLALAACEKPDPVKPVQSLDLKTKSLTFEYTGGTQSVSLEANCAWTAEAQGWVTVAPVSGNGNTNVSVIAAENAGAAREAKVVFKSEDGTAKAELLVAQASKPDDTNPNPPEPQGNVIKTAAELADFFKAAPSMTAEDEWTIEADIDCGGTVVDGVSSFAGVLDGKGHKIYNLVVECTDAKTGLVLSNAGIIKNIVFGSKDGKDYDGKSAIKPAAGKGGNHTGLVADNMGTLEKVESFIPVSFEANADPGARVGIGGLVGNSSVASTITDCVNHATINAVGEITQETSIGGIIGFAQANEIKVVNCVNVADLVVNLPVKKVIMIGGICGRTNGEVLFENCENKGAVSYEQAEAPSTWMAIGGIGGVYYNGTKIMNCKNSGAISSNLLQASRVAGILGTLNSGGRVENCVNDGNVTIDQAEPNANWETASGIVGLQEKDSKDAEGNQRRNIITGNTNNGKVTIKVENTTTHQNRVSAAGIIGIGCLDVDVTNNTNKGAISIENKADGDAFCGGIMAMAIVTDVKMSGNVNSGAVSCKTSDDAKSCAGGVVADAGRYPGKSDVTTVTVTGDKNTGAVTCGNAAMTGSIAGLNLGTLKDCLAGGSVNGTKLTADNLGTLTQGSASTGSAEGTTLAN